MSDRTTVAMQAGAVRHVASGGAITAEIRKALDDAAATLDYHATHPALMRACAYFQHKDVDKVFETFPDAQIERVSK